MVKKIIFLFVAAFLSLLTLVFASQSQYHSDLGNITSDLSIYSCWPSCAAYINLTTNDTGPFAGSNLTVSLNNSAEASPINFAIYWKNETGDWALQGNNDSFINNSNLNLTGTQQFMINISLTSALSTKWNVSFNVNGTDYVLDPYLDSIGINSPANYNITTDQTPNFNFTLFSENVTKQSCTIYTKYNNTGSWSSRGTNSSVINGTSTVITVITASSMPRGNYTWKVTCNESGDSEIRWVYIRDITAPTISSLSASVESSTSATVSWITTESANSSFNYGTTTSYGTTDSSGSFTTSHSYPLTDLSASTEYYYNATSCDASANCASQSGSFTTSSYVPGDIGGGGSVVQTQKKIRRWAKLNEGETGTWNVNSKDLGLKQINITVINESKSVEISISKVLVLPSSITEKSGEIYKYLKIETKNIKGLNKSSIMLQIENTWMENNSFSNSEASLFKFDNSSNQWKKINTEFSSEDSKYHYFNSEVDSFSYFAIAGEKTTAPDSDSDSDSGTTTPSNVSSTEPAALEEDEEKGSTGIIIMIIIIAIVAVGVVAFIIYSQLFKKKK